MLLVVALHVVIVYALASGLARQGLELVKWPLEVAMIKEAAPPPPPPPPAVRPDVKLPNVLQPPLVMPPPIAIETPPPVAPPLAQVPKEPPPIAKPDVIAPRPLAIVQIPVESSADKLASLEGDYVGKLRSMLNAAKRYPTGRQASQQRPQGKVKLWFVVARAGSLVEVGVMASSNSNLLDDAALATLRRSTYPAFPANTWPGEEQHKFSVELEFSPPSS